MILRRIITPRDRDLRLLNVRVSEQAMGCEQTSTKHSQ